MLRIFCALLLCASVASCKHEEVTAGSLQQMQSPAPPPSEAADAAPTIDGAPATRIEIGKTYRFTPSATSQDGKPLVFSITHRPSWSSFDTKSGVLTGTPAAGDAGDYAQVIISAATGTLSASLAPFTIHVVAPQAVPPSIAGTPATTVIAGSPYEFMPIASSASGAPLTFNVTNKPAWASFEAATGSLRGTPGSADVGVSPNIVITASDGATSAQLPSFSIEVTQIAMGSASLSWIAPAQNTDGSALTDLAGFRIHYGTSPSSLGTTVTLAGTSVLSHLVENLTPATWYFAVTAYTTTGVESEWSAIVSKRIP